MVNNYGVLESRGYKGSVSYSVNDDCCGQRPLTCGYPHSGKWHGKIVDIGDLVTYKADSYEELVEEFKDAVLEYIDDLQWRSNLHLYILQGE